MYLFQDSPSVIPFSPAVVISFAVACVVVGSALGGIVWRFSQHDSRLTQIEAQNHSFDSRLNKHVDNREIHHDAKWLESKFEDIKDAIEKTNDIILQYIGKPKP